MVHNDMLKVDEKFDDLADIVPGMEKSYNRDLFIFLYFLPIIVSAVTSFTIHHGKSPFYGKSILYLNRHQTEECKDWKGWMQNAICLSIAAKIIIVHAVVSGGIEDPKGLFGSRKYEEIKPPEVEDFCYITDNTFSKEEVTILVV
ncbi:hypothetical protein TSUD_22530 [Trifolium subterraneum]|uniref:B-like cyclin n=1 Tax=Trifolium subterraneum TaxID=3900 RepID=A0A2Z6NLK8_TRISU|nr:hypothetical protein TSUD_22530 [Trifolium subterraneum]